MVAVGGKGSVTGTITQMGLSFITGTVTPGLFICHFPPIIIVTEKGLLLVLPPIHIF